MAEAAQPKAQAQPEEEPASEEPQPTVVEPMPRPTVENIHIPIRVDQFEPVNFDDAGRQIDDELTVWEAECPVCKTFKQATIEFWPIRSCYIIRNRAAMQRPMVPSDLRCSECKDRATLADEGRQIDRATLADGLRWALPPLELREEFYHEWYFVAGVSSANGDH